MQPESWSLPSKIYNHKEYNKTAYDSSIIKREHTTNFKLPVSKEINTQTQELPLPLQACGSTGTEA